MKRARLIIYFVLVFIIFCVVGILIRQRLIFADELTSTSSYIPQCGQCASITVKCDTPEQLKADCSQTAAACTVDKCAIAIPRATCENQKLTPIGSDLGSVYIDTKDLSQKLNCTKGGDNISSAFDVEDCCTLSHEVAHACDPKMAGVVATDPAGRCLERIAQNYENECRKKSVDSFCAESSPSYDDKVACERACELAEFYETVKVYDNCMCEATHDKGDNNATDATCCNCYKECTDTTKIRNLIPTSCQKAYDARGAASNKDSLESICKGAVKGDAGHGCGLYGGSKDFDADTSCASHGYPMPCFSGTVLPQSIITEADKVCVREKGDKYKAKIIKIIQAKCVVASNEEQSSKDICRNSTNTGSICGPGMHSDERGGFGYDCVLKDSVEGKTSVLPPAIPPVATGGTSDSGTGATSSAGGATSTGSTTTSGTSGGTITSFPSTPPVVPPKAGTIPITTPSATGWVYWKNGVPTAPTTAPATPAVTSVTTAPTPAIIAPVTPSLLSRIANVFNPQPVTATVITPQTTSTGWVYWQNGIAYNVNPTVAPAAPTASAPIIVTTTTTTPSLLSRIANVFSPKPVTITSSQLMSGVAPK